MLCRSLARRLAVLLVIGGSAALAVPLGCSTTEVIAAAPAPGADEDAGDPGAEPDPADASASRDAARTTGEAAWSACTSAKRCEPGLVCIRPGDATGTGGVCRQACEKQKDCEDWESCDVGYCTLFCESDVNCPRALHCDGVKCSILDCKNVPGACSTAQQCNAEGFCVDKPVACTKTPTTGLTASATLTSLTAAQRGTFCDWSACQLGGYGAKATCDGGLSVSQPADQAACLAKLPATCAATVAQLEACTAAQAADPCNLDIVLNGAACAPLLACR